MNKIVSYFETDFKKLLKKIESIDIISILKFVKNISKYKITLISIVILSIISTIAHIIGPTFLGNVTTELFNGITNKIQNGSDFNLSGIQNTIIILVILYVSNLVLSAGQNILLINMSQKISYDLKNRLFNKLNRLPIKNIENKKNGEFLSIITIDVETLTQSFVQAFNQIISSLFIVPGIIIILFITNWIIAVLSLTILVISIFITKIIMKKSQHCFTEQQNCLGHINAHVEETYSKQNVIQSFTSQNTFKRKFKKLNKNIYESAWKSQFYSGILFPLSKFFNNIVYLIVAIVGGIFAINNMITVGTIQAFIQYVKMLSHPIESISQVIALLQTTAAASRRIFDALEWPEISSEIKHEVDTSKIHGNIEFSNANFEYTPNQKVLKDFNMQIKKGEKVAIVGPTGAGKTTISKLLLAFYKLQSGSILIDNKEISKFDKNDLRKMFGLVLQDVWIFSGTIMENIRYGNLNATDGQVIEAAKAIGLDEFVNSLENGYYTEISEDSTNISAGQKQLISIARVMLSDPKIVILDEATSNMDPITELMVQKAILPLIKNRTCLVITHKLSTIKNMDKVIVVNHGEIVESGTHDQFMQKDGLYKNIFSSQFNH